MAISVRFHYREHLGGADSFPHDLGVVPQRASIDFSPAAMRFFHASILSFGMVMCGSRK